MIKNLLTFLLFGSLSLSAQTPLTTAVDFTATDVDGNQFKLFDKLDEGKFVLLDFMFTNCGPCQATGPRLHQAFMNYGANSPSAQVYFVTINRDDNNAVLKNWEITHMSPNGPYPRGISGTQGSATAGPQTFSSVYGITAYPTMILIAPNKQIVEQDIWPISSANDFTPYFQSHGINPSPVSIESNILDENALQLFPNPSQNVVNIAIQNQTIKQINVFDLLGKQVFRSNFEGSANQTTIDVSELSNGIYITEVITTSNQKVLKKLIKK